MGARSESPSRRRAVLLEHLQPLSELRRGIRRVGEPAAQDVEVGATSSIPVCLHDRQREPTLRRSQQGQRAWPWALERRQLWGRGRRARPRHEEGCRAQPRPPGPAPQTLKKAVVRICGTMCKGL